MTIDSAKRKLVGSDSTSVDYRIIPLERVATLSADTRDVLLDPETIFHLLSNNLKLSNIKIESENKNITPKKNRPISTLKIGQFSKTVTTRLFKFLNIESKNTILIVCREWNILGCDLKNNEKLKELRAQEIIFRTNFISLDQRMNRALLRSFNPDFFTSTQLSLSVSEMFLQSEPCDKEIANRKKLLLEEFSTDPQLTELFQHVFKTEKEHVGTYQPFYHAMNTSVFLFGFSVKIFLQVMNKNLKSDSLHASFSSIHWFRFPQLEDSNYPQTIEAFFEQYSMSLAVKDGGDHDDHHPDIKQWLMSVSPFLFSNFHKSGESTFELFTTNKSVYPPSAEWYFNLLCDHFKLLPDPSIREGYANKFSDIIGTHYANMQSFLKKSRPAEQRKINFEDRGNRDRGVLFQVLVPKPIVDQVVYPCMEYGIPAQFRNQKISTVFKNICADPTSQYSVNAQARILTSSLVTRGNEIKVLSYGHTEYFSSLQGKALYTDFEQLFTSIVEDS
jgi:hypothetical protein